MSRPRVVVIGGGIAGLTVTYELLMQRSERLPHDIDLRCLEGADRAGGNIRTTREDGFLCEWGATGFLDNTPATMTLVRRLELEERSVGAREAAARRFVYRNGKLREIPLSAAGFLTSGVLSPWGKLRLLGEPLVPARRAAGTESVFDFASRAASGGRRRECWSTRWSPGSTPATLAIWNSTALSPPCARWSPSTAACSGPCWPGASVEDRAARPDPADG